MVSLDPHMIFGRCHATRGFARRCAAIALALALAGCAGNDVPVPFVQTPEPQAADAESTGAVPAAPPPTPVAAAAATPQTTARPTTPPPGRRRDPGLPFPSVGAAPSPAQRPVMDAAAQAKMEADLEALARNREQQLRRDIEQSQ